MLFYGDVQIRAILCHAIPTDLKPTIQCYSTLSFVVFWFLLLYGFLLLLLFCLVCFLFVVVSPLPPEIVFMGIFGITMFVKLLCRYVYCSCFHDW